MRLAPHANRVQAGWVATRIRHHLKERIARLEQRYGRPLPPPADPFELVLLENCA